MMTAASVSNSFGVEHGLLASAVATQRALFADGVGALEDPVLPGGKPGEDFGFHRLRSAEAKVGLQAGEAVGREACALFEEHADLILPVEVVEREGDEAELGGSLGVELLADRLACAFERLRLAEKPRLQPRQAVAHPQAPCNLPARDDRGPGGGG